MQALEKPLRNQLEKTVKLARDIAEAAAKAALEQLAAGNSKPWAQLDEPARDLRRRLRAHGRQLGDHRHPDGAQTTGRLKEKVAYEHWHRMLFARFLAENELLMYPDPDDPVVVTLEECEDLAAEEGAANGWELAARFAGRMLPQIFRLDSPVFELSFSPEHQQKLERLVTDLPPDVFTASDSLGWVYQFWQAKKKDEVNESEVKIGANELPAVTQLFTEPYMVSFLLDNSLGAWWAARRLAEADFQNAGSEEELRRKASIPGVPLEYLRFVRHEDGPWKLAGGTFDHWPEQLAELKVLDPCCGSGHFLVAAFLILVPMRMELDGLSANEAADAVLSENIHGLELDPRCVELAAFALALTAWNYPDAGGYRVLPELHVACSGLSVSVAREEWTRLARGDHNLRIAMGWLHDNFRDAPLLGSLLDPAGSEAARIVRWDKLSEALDQALKQEQNRDASAAQQEVAVVAQGLARAASLLAGRYHWVITNVPYLARGKQSERLRNFCETRFPTAKNDLATVFLDRCLELASTDSETSGTVSVVLPQNWLFLTRYRKFREKLLTENMWHLIGYLGPGAFETISGEVVKAVLIILSRGIVHCQSDGLFSFAKHENQIGGIEVSKIRSVKEKATCLLTRNIMRVGQIEQLSNPDFLVTFDEVIESRLELNASTLQGIATSDNSHYVREFWEVLYPTSQWHFLQSAPATTSHYGGRTRILRSKFLTDQNHKGNVSGKQGWGKSGIAVTEIEGRTTTIYTGEHFVSNCHAIIPINQEDLSIYWCYAESGELGIEARKQCPKLAIKNGYFNKVPFARSKWQRQVESFYPRGLPRQYTDNATQWIFHAHPCGSVIWNEETKWTDNGELRTDDTVLQVAVARLLGYRWPAEFDAEMELADEQRNWVEQCKALREFVDEDGIVCISPVQGEDSAADRLLSLLAAAYGDAWSTHTLPTLLKNAGHAGKTLETWLRDKFFSQHCDLFHHRPFIWHIWDGLRDGFSALVNYHKLDAKLLETLIFTYLGDWINRQKQDIANGIEGAQERLAAAENLGRKLELILEGEDPYDIFVRWKPLDEQPLGWNPDLNDGVRLNIRPFMRVPDVGKKGAGVLRDKPNIHWNKDRGKDVQSAPWHHEFQGDRINDHHLTLADKRAAREGETQS